MGGGVWDHGDADPVVLLAGDRQRHPVERDRALLDAVALQVGRHAGPQVAAVLGVDRAGDPAAAVDVPLHQVPAERIPRPQRPFEVERGADRRLAEPGARQRLLAQVELGDPTAEPRLEADDGAADARQRDRVADPERPRQVAEGHGEP